MSIDRGVLSVEIATDPGALGYASHVASGNDGAVAELLNRIRVGIVINRDTITPNELFEAIVPSEWAAASAQEKQRIGLILAMPTVDLRGPNTKAALQAAFGPGTTTRANIIAMLSRSGSRAEQLFGSGTRVDHSDVAVALRGPTP